MMPRLLPGEGWARAPAGPFGWRSQLRFKGRLALAALAIALGVALGYAVQLINASAVVELEQGLRTLSGSADLSVVGPRSGLDVALYPLVARHAAVAQASPVVEIRVRLPGSGESLRLIGRDAMRASAMGAEWLGEAEDPLDALRDDVIHVRAEVADRLGVRAGDSIVVEGADGTRTLRVAALISVSGMRAGDALVDIAAAQALSGRTDRVSWIDVRLRPGFEPEASAQALRGRLPEGVSVRRPEDTIEANLRVSRAYRVNLSVLALVALFTGGMLVFSTQALAVARRRGELSLLRALGLTRAELLRGLLKEAFWLGAAGALAGIAIGGGIGHVVLRTVGADLGAGFFRGVAPAFQFSVWAAFAFFAAGVATTLLGAAVPALEACREPPATGLRSAARAPRLDRLRTVTPGLVTMAIGLVLLSVPPVDGLPWAAYAAIACFLIGVITMLPVLCAVILRALPRPSAASGWLAIERVSRGPSEVAITLAAMVAAISLMVAMLIMVASFRDSMERWLDQLLPADLYLRVAASAGTLISVAEQERLRSTAGIRRVEFLRTDQVLLEPSRPAVALLARDIDPGNPGARLPLLESRPVRAGETPVWVSEVAAGLHGLRLGQVFELPLGTAAPPVTVAGIWRDYGRPQGAIVLERDRYTAITGERRANDVAVWLDTESSRGAVVRALDWLAPRTEMLTPGEIRRLSLATFDRTFAVTYALELAAVLIGLVGLSSGFGASVSARRREFGVLRHLGLRRVEIARMLAAEGAATSLAGVVLGGVTGLGISVVLIHIVNPQSFHWTMELELPIAPLALLGALVLVLSAGTAVLSGWQAMSAEAIRAVKDDW